MISLGKTWGEENLHLASQLNSLALTASFKLKTLGSTEENLATSAVEDAELQILIWTFSAGRVVFS